MESPLVSIITPTFNRAHLIIETLVSIQKQTYNNWEWIVVDDGSSDDTFALFDNYTQDRRIKYFTRPVNVNKGANACRNYGVSNSEGKYLIFLDSDDILAADCLENRTKYLDNLQLDMLVFSMGFIKNGKFENKDISFLSQKTKSEILAMFVKGALPWNMSMPIWKKDFFLKHKGFNEMMHWFDDEEFHIRALSDDNIKFTFVNKTDCYYRIYEENTIKAKDVNFLKRLAASHLILLQTINVNLSKAQKKAYRKSIQSQMVKIMYYLGDAFSVKKMFFKNIFYFFYFFEASIIFKVVLLTASAFNLYPSRYKGAYKINFFFKNELYKLSR